MRLCRVKPAAAAIGRAAPVSALWPRLAGFRSASGRGRAETLFLPEWLLRLLKHVKARQPHIREIAFTETL
jgi:hypothetical protein